MEKFKWHDFDPREEDKIENADTWQFDRAESYSYGHSPLARILQLHLFFQKAWDFHMRWQNNNEDLY